MIPFCLVVLFQAGNCFCYGGASSRRCRLCWPHRFVHIQTSVLYCIFIFKLLSSCIHLHSGLVLLPFLVTLRLSGGSGL